MQNVNFLVLPLFFHYVTPLWSRYSLSNSFFIHISLEWWSESFSKIWNL